MIRASKITGAVQVGVGGRLWSTVTDLLTWRDALMGGAPQVVPTAVIDAMQTLHVLTDTESWAAGWGLGLAVTRRAGRTVAGLPAPCPASPPPSTSIVRPTPSL
jgi:hypothetical protein